MAVIPVFCMTKAMPSDRVAVPGVIWKLKSVVNEVMLMGWPYQPAPAWPVAPLVRRSDVPTTAALPFSASGTPDEKPPDRLIGGVESMEWKPEETALCVKYGAGARR